MDSWAEEVLELARRLPREDRLKIAAALQQQEGEVEAPELSEAWRKEIVRRIQAHRRGELRTVDGEEMFARLRAKYG